jgi:ubiquinone/menaquinone biosynthesis C-methylase UbiE
MKSVHSDMSADATAGNAARMARRAEPELMDLPEEAEAYARADFAAVNQAFVERLVELAGAREQAAVLDLGAGPGDIAIRLARRRPGWRIVAADAAQAMLDLARKAVDAAGLARQIELALVDAKATRLPEGSFDIVASNSLLHHVADPAALWRELRRLARPGATLLLRDLMRPASEAAASAIVQQYAGGESKLLQEEFHRSLLAAYTVEEVRDQLARAGLAGLSVAIITDRHLDVFGRLA